MARLSTGGSYVPERPSPGGRARLRAGQVLLGGSRGHRHRRRAVGTGIDDAKIAAIVGERLDRHIGELATAVGRGTLGPAPLRALVAFGGVDELIGRPPTSRAPAGSSMGRACSR